MPLHLPRMPRKWAFQLHLLWSRWGSLVGHLLFVASLFGLGHYVVWLRSFISREKGLSLNSCSLESVFNQVSACCPDPSLHYCRFTAPEERSEKLSNVFPEKEIERASEHDVRHEIDSKAQICWSKSEKLGNWGRHTLPFREIL